MSAAENILSAISSALSGAGIAASIERDRTIAFEIEDLPGIVIKPKSEESTPMGTASLRCTLNVEIEIHVRGNQPSTLADPFAASVQSALIASPTLNGLIARLFRSGKEWDFTDSDGTGGCLRLSYQIHYAEPI